LTAGSYGEIYEYGAGMVVKKMTTVGKRIPYSFIMEALLQCYLSFLGQKMQKILVPKLFGVSYPRDRKGEMLIESFEEDLWERIDENPTLDFICETLLAIIDKIELVQFFCRNRFIHGDLHPSNIMWKEEVGYCLIDLGQSCLIHEGLTLSVHGESLNKKSVGKSLYFSNTIYKCENRTHDLRMLCTALVEEYGGPEYLFLHQMKKYLFKTYNFAKINYEKKKSKKLQDFWHCMYDEVIHLSDLNFAPKELRKVIQQRKWTGRYTLNRG